MSLPGIEGICGWFITKRKVDRGLKCVCVSVCVVNLLFLGTMGKECSKCSDTAKYRHPDSRRKTVSQNRIEMERKRERQSDH